VAQIVGTNRDDVVKRVEQVDTARKEGTERERGVRSELGDVLGKTVCQDRVIAKGEGVVWVNRAEKATHDFEFLQSIANVFIATAAATTTAGHTDGGTKTTEAKTKNDPVIVVTSALPGKGQTALLLVQSLDQDGAKEINEKLKSALDSLASSEDGSGAAPEGKRVKGGGARGRYMSKVEGKWSKKEDEVVREVIAGLNGQKS
jgi:alanyl-tRNA synthetase